MNDQITNINKLANLVDTAAMDATAIDQLSQVYDFDLDDAYRMQAASVRNRIERGETLLGYKLGFTSRAKMEQMGVHELIWGKLTDSMKIENKGEISMIRFIHPRAEPEIAFRIKKDIDKIISIDEAHSYIDAVAVAIEIIDSRYKNFKFSLADVIADNCSSSAFVIGDWHSADSRVSNLKISLSINGKEVQSGNTDAILGNPFESLVEASRILAKYGEQLKEGMVLLAGAATPAVHINSKDKVTAVCEELGEISFEVL